VGKKRKLKGVEEKLAIAEFDYRVGFQILASGFSGTAVMSQNGFGGINSSTNAAPFSIPFEGKIKGVNLFNPHGNEALADIYVNTTRVFTSSGDGFHPKEFVISGGSTLTVRYDSLGNTSNWPAVDLYIEKTAQQAP
jgi:hypothetical protein